MLWISVDLYIEKQQKTAIMELTEKMQELLQGEQHPNMDFVICLGQSDGSKGVLFTMYAFRKNAVSQYANVQNYMGNLADDLENAIVAARRKIKHYAIQIWNDETFRTRKIASIDPTIEFGKYKGSTVSQIFDKDVDYLFWLSRKGNFKAKYMRDVMAQYGELSKCLIVERNTKTNKEPLEVDLKLKLRELNVLSIFEGVGLNDAPLYTVKLTDEEGNKFYYKGTTTQLKDVKKNDTLNFKAKLVSHFESMGITYNVLKMR